MIYCWIVMNQTWELVPRTKGLVLEDWFLFAFDWVSEEWGRSQPLLNCGWRCSTHSSVVCWWFVHYKRREPDWGTQERSCFIVWDDRPWVDALLFGHGGVAGGWTCFPRARKICRKCSEEILDGGVQAHVHTHDHQLEEASCFWGRVGGSCWFF